MREALRAVMLAILALVAPAVAKRPLCQDALRASGADRAGHRAAAVRCRCRKGWRALDRERCAPTPVHEKALRRGAHASTPSGRPAEPCATCASPGLSATTRRLRPLDERSGHGRSTPLRSRRRGRAAVRHRGCRPVRSASPPRPTAPRSASPSSCPAAALHRGAGARLDMGAIRRRLLRERQHDRHRHQSGRCRGRVFIFLNGGACWDRSPATRWGRRRTSRAATARRSLPRRRHVAHQLVL